MDDNENTGPEANGDDTPAVPTTMTDVRGREVPLDDAQKALLEKHWMQRWKMPKPKPADDAAPKDDVAPEDEQIDEAPRDDDEQPAAAKDGYELDVPDEVPTEHYDGTKQNIEMAGQLGKELGVPVEEIQGVVDYAVSLAVTDQSGTNLSDKDACLGTLMARYGNAEGAKIVEDAQRAVKRLGPKVAAFLDGPGQLGNSPAVLMALASYERGDLRMSPEKAQAELDKLTKGEDLRSAYRNANHPGHKAAVDRANLLYAIAAKGDAKKSTTDKKAPPVKTTAKMAEDKLDAEIALAIKEPGYRKGDKAVLARVRELYARRYPDNQ